MRLTSVRSEKRLALCSSSSSCMPDHRLMQEMSIVLGHQLVLLYVYCDILPHNKTKDRRISVLPTLRLDYDRLDQSISSLNLPTDCLFG
jgi:hypothetical protein